MKVINDEVTGANSLADVLSVPGFDSDVVAGVPLTAQALIWDVFFASRGRGLDIRTHFPWIGEIRGIHCVTVMNRDGGELVATLVIREAISGQRGGYALIGMVSVGQPWRGRGLSRQLMGTALSFAAMQSINALVLWTGQPDFYSRYGFVPDSCEAFGRVELNFLRPTSQVRFVRTEGDATRGLPPFGRELVRFQSLAAELICVETGNGLTLAEWKGPLPAVLDLAEAALPSMWSVNARADSPIFDEINHRGHRYTPLSGGTRMVRYLDTPTEVPYTSVLNRI